MKHTILSLFSCCGGLDLGMEGGFTADARQIDAKKHADWIAGYLEDGRVLLSENDFATVFANDIDKNAKAAWTRFFQKKNGKTPEYVLGSIIELVKQSKNGTYKFPEAEIVTGGFPCLVGNTLVLTTTGYKPIKEITPGDEVIAEDGHPHKVIRNIYQGKKRIYRIENPGTISLRGTSNHRFLVKEKRNNEMSSPIWKELKDICDGDYLCVPEHHTARKPENGAFCEDGMLWFPAGIVVDEKINEDVYDLEVEEVHSFVANGCVVHNCCDFSVSGKRQGFNSTKSDTEENLDAPSPESRGMLYYWMREVIDIVKPKIFIAENVKGLTTLGNVQQIIEQDFSTCGNGYIVVPARVLHSADYGVAQNRERVIFFGFDKTCLTKEALMALESEEIPPQYDPYPSATHNYKNREDESLLPFYTVREAMKGLGEPEQSTDPSHATYSRCKYMGAHCQGQTEVNLDGVGPTIRSKHHGNIEYRRLAKIHGGTHDEELSQGLEERRLSVRECARIQSFPDEYEFVFPKEEDEQGNIKDGVSGSAAYVLVGNAVPPVLAYNIARRIMDCWDIWFEEEDVQPLKN